MRTIAFLLFIMLYYAVSRVRRMRHSATCMLGPDDFKPASLGVRSLSHSHHGAVTSVCARCRLSHLLLINSRVSPSDVDGHLNPSSRLTMDLFPMVVFGPHLIPDVNVII